MSHQSTGRAVRLLLIVLLALSAFPVSIGASDALAAESAVAKVAGARTVPARSDFGDAPYVDGELLVRFAPEVSAAGRGLAHAALGSRSKRAFRLVRGLESVMLRRGTTVEQAVAAYEAMPGVLYAQPNYRKYAAAIPDDAYFGDLWGMHNTGQRSGTIDADIDAPEAWEVTTGTADVVIAVIDSGVDYNHPDLAANMWVNPGEIADNHIDDDGNGYVDDVHGIDAVNNDGDPMDDHGHGTHCAGTIGAVGNDGFGIAGVNWDVSIMAVKSLAADGGGSTEDAVEAFEYIDAMGADLSSNSWGGVYPFDHAEYDAIAAVDKLFVFAAGNDADNIDGASVQFPSTNFYPAAYTLPNILVVGASDNNDDRGSFSNYGAVSVDVFAPGVEILSTQPMEWRISIAPGSTETTVFTEDFTTFASWTTTGYAALKEWERTTGAYTSAPSSAAHLGYQDNEEAYIDQIDPLDLTASDWPALRFQWRYDTEPGWDYVYVLVGDESDATWYFLEEASGDSAGFRETVVDLRRFAGQSDVHLSFGILADDYYDSDQGYEGVWVDDVEVIDLDPEVPGTSPWTREPVSSWEDAYVAWDGTSMATPHVAGIAGLLLSEESTRTWQELKEGIMSTVDEKPAFEGLCVTGGRVNAASAVGYEFVNDPPVTTGDSYATNRNTALSVASPGVLANDSDPNGHALSATKVTGPAHGTLALSANGGFKYTPEADYIGTDSFTYTASDGYGGISAPTTVQLTVNLESGDFRISGEDRYLTGVEASKRGFSSAGTVVIATGGNWPDALGGSALAGAVDGPLLLTAPTELPLAVRDEIERLGATKAYILGGTGAVSGVVETELRAMLGSVERLAGTDRYDTARLIADETISLLGAGYGGGVLVATGGKFPDATAASPLAAVLGRPIVLANPATGSVLLPAQATSAVILGGTGVVSPAVESGLVARLGEGTVKRIGGANRYDTAALVAEYGVGAGMSWNGVGLATGKNFPDALAGGAMLASTRSVMLLTESDVLSPEAEAMLSENASSISTLFVIGGTSAVFPETLTAARRAAGVS